MDRALARTALALAAAVLLAPAAADAKKPPKEKKTYTVGMASRSVSLDANGTFAKQPVYLGGFGIGNGRALEHFGNVENPGPKPADNGLSYDDGRAATGNLADGLHVRAAVVSAGKSNFAIADIENQGCFTQNKQGYGLVTMRLAVQQRTRGRLPASHVNIQCDHSHGGPDLIGAWGGVPNEYLKYVQEQAIDAIVEAFQTQRPAELWYGTAQSGVAGRDKLPEDKTDPLLTNQMLNDPTRANEVMDDELRVLQARDPKTGEPFATILNLNSHPTVLGSGNLRASGDWPQFANTLMTQDAGTFGSESVTIVGTLGRQQPNRGGCPDPALAAKGDSDPQSAICKATAYAERVIKRAKEALAAAKPLEGKPEVVAKTYLIQDPATNAGIMSFNLAGDAIGIPIMRSTSTPWLTGNVVGSVTGSARIGSILFSSMPGEAYPQIPLTVRDALKGSGITGFMTAGLSNDQLGYIISTLPEAYPQVLIAGAGGNDNILFNMSQTLGERLTCSLLRGAGEVIGKGRQYWQGYSKCVAFANDLASPEGADVAPFSHGDIAPAPAAGEQGAWLAGDLHVHTTYSHDSWGGPFDDNTSDPQDWYTLGHSIASEFTLAKSRGLDYLAITDHNDIRAQQDPDFGRGGLIGVPAYENSLKGHGQMLGARRIYDKGDLGQAAVQQMQDELHADGGLLQANHPHDPRWGYAESLVPDSIEVWNLPWLYQAPFPSSSDNDWSLNWYEGWLDRGFQIAATGGSDSHWVSTSALQGVGQPTTWVFAKERSADGVIEAIDRGRTFISYQPPNYGGPKVTLEADTPKAGAWDAMLGDTVPRSSKLRAHVIGAPGAQLKLTTNGGKALAQVAVTSADFTYEFTLPKGSASTWALAELFGDDLSPQRKAACEGAVGDQTSYCRNRVLMLGLTSPIYFAG